MVKIGSRKVVQLIDHIESVIKIEDIMEELDNLIVGRQVKLEDLPDAFNNLREFGLFNIHHLTIDELKENEYIKSFGNGYEHPKAGDKEYGFRKLRAGYLAFLTDTNFHIDNYSFVRNFYYHGPEEGEKKGVKISRPFKIPALQTKDNQIFPMELGPDEIISFNNRSENASGNVLICGCGIGFTAYTLSLRKDVDSITILENDPNVIKLFKENIEPAIGKQIRIIECDALDYLGISEKSKGIPQEDLRKYNYIDVDTWFSLEDMMYPYLKCLQLEQKYPDVKFSYWLESDFYNKIVKEIFRCLIKLRQSEAAFKKYKGNNYMLTNIAKYILTESDIEIMTKEDLDIIISPENVRESLLRCTIDNAYSLELFGMAARTSKAMATTIASDPNLRQKAKEEIRETKLAKLAKITGNNGKLIEYMAAQFEALKEPLQKK